LHCCGTTLPWLYDLAISFPLNEKLWATAHVREKYYTMGIYAI